MSLQCTYRRFILRGVSLLFDLLLVFSIVPQRGEAGHKRSCTLEPTDQMIDYGDVVACEINPAGDIDVFRFFGRAGEVVAIQVIRTGGSLYPCFTLTDPDGMAVAGAACGWGSPAQREFPALTKTGEYKIEVFVGGPPPSGTMPYELNLQRTVPPLDPIRISLLPPGNLLRGEIDHLGDIDFYVFGFAPVPGDQAIIRVSRTNGSIYPCFRLFDPDGIPVGDGVCGYGSPAERRFSGLTKTGIYTVRVYVAGPAGPQTMTYDIFLQCIGKCSSPPVSKIGVFGSGLWYLDVDGNGRFDAGDRFCTWGSAGSIPVVGDWNADGRTKIGAFGGGFFYLDYNGNCVFDAQDKVMGWGRSTSTPVVGDWNGDGKTKIGIFEGGFWYLDTNGDGLPDGTDCFAHFGDATSIPVVGDWNGDGRTKIGAFGGGFFYLDYNGNCGFDTQDKVIGWGSGTSTPVVGDWNGDRRTKIGIFEGGFWYLDTNGNGLWDAGDMFAHYGSAGSTPVLGDWSGDRRTKIGAYGDGFWFLDANGNGAFDRADRVFNFGQSGDNPIVGFW